MMTLHRRVYRFSGAALVAGGLLLLALALVSRANAVPGAADHDFGAGGDVLTDVGGSDLAYGVAVQPDGGVVVAGTSDARDGKFNLLLLRYDVWGQPVTGFGEGGVSLTDLGGTDVGYAATVQPDGRIIVAGVSDRGDERSLVILRFTAEGQLDPSFGTGGVVRLAAGTDYPMTMAVTTQPDGAIVLAAHLPEADRYLLQLMRFLPDGTTDTSFGVQGAAILPFRGADGALAVTAGPDGALYVAGSGRGDGTVVLALARYTTERGLEPWPPKGIELQVGLGGHRSTALHWMEDGALVVAAYFLDGEQHSLFLARTTPDDEWEVLADATAGSTPAIAESLEEPYALAAHLDGRFVVAGSTSGDVALRRYAGMLGVGSGTGTETPTIVATPRTPRPTVFRTPTVVITRTPAPPATTSPATATPTSSPPTATATAVTPAPTAPAPPTVAPTVPPTPMPTAPPTMIPTPRLPPPTPSPPITATPGTPAPSPTQPPAPTPRVPTATPAPTLPPVLPTLPPLPPLLPLLPLLRGR